MLANLKKRISYYFNRENAWQTIILTFAFFLLALILANSYIFWRLQKEAIEPISADVRIQAVKREKLEQVLKNLDEKERRFEQNLLTKPDISDPSL